MKKKKKIIIIVVALLVVGGVVGGVIIKKNANNLAVNQEMTDSYLGTPAISLSKQDLSNNINVTGVVESQNIVKVTTSLTQSVKTLNVGLGDYVNEGDILCVFDDTEIKKEIQTLKESIAKSSTLTENQKKTNQRALERAKEDKTIQLNAAQRAIDEAQQEYNKANQKYNDSINKYNDLVIKVGDLKNILDTTPAPEYSVDNDDMSMSGSGSTATDPYTIAQQNYETAKAEMEQAKTAMESYEEQLPSLEKAITAAKDAYDTTLRTANQQIEACQETIDNQGLQDTDNSQQSQLEKLEKSLEDTIVKAPKSGTITSLSIAEGSIATDGTIMTIENTDGLKITVDIKESDILKLKEGMKAVITADATGDEEISGTVDKVITTVSSNGGAGAGAGAGAGTTSSGYKAEISISGKSKLLIGMNAKAKIMLDEKANVYAVPYDAITTNENGDDVVYVATPDNAGTTYKISEVKITKGMDTTYYTEISGSDLKDGIIVITDPSSVAVGDTITQLDIQSSDVNNNTDNLDSSKDIIIEGGEAAYAS